MSGHVTIDARLATASGIGTYLRALVPRVITRMGDCSFTLLGDVAALESLVPPPARARVRVRSCRAPVYGVREQLALARAVPRDTSLLWSPHYNVSLLYRGRLAVTVHDVNHLALPQASRVRTMYARAMFGAVLRRADMVFCDSRFTEVELARLAGVPRKSAVVHLGVERSWFEVRPSAPPIREPYFLYVGAIRPHKNLGRLVAAFAAAKVGAHRLLIVGRREGLLTEDRAVADAASALGDRVLFTGHLAQGMLECYVAGCDALVMPSLYEGFGLPPLEAMACGRAVAVASAGSLPEVCGPEAMYFDPLDVSSIGAALEALARRPADGEAVRARRRAWAARYDWDRCAERTEIGLRRAVDGRAS